MKFETWLSEPNTRFKRTVYEGTSEVRAKDAAGVVIEVLVLYKLTGTVKVVKLTPMGQLDEILKIWEYQNGTRMRQEYRP